MKKRVLSSATPVDESSLPIGCRTADPLPGDGDDSFGTACDLGVVTSGYSFSGASISVAGDLDYYKFTLASDIIVILETCGVSNGDTIITLYDSAYNQLGGDDDGGVDRYSKLVKALSAGTYYAQVRGYGSATISDYSLSITLTDRMDDLYLSGQYT